jgi:lipoyl synthase
VRSSYRAAEVFLRSLLGKGGEGEAAAPNGHVDAKWVESMLGERLSIARREAARVNLEIGAASAPHGAMPPEPSPGLPGLEGTAGLLPASSLVRR